MSSPTGLNGVSFAGGVDIVIQGPPFSPAEELQVIFEGIWPITGTWRGPPPTNDNAFNSMVVNGMFQYTTPSIPSLIGASYEDLNELQTFSFQLGVVDPAYQDESHGDPTINCGSGSACNYVTSRGFTPLLYYLSPRVVYDGAEVDFWVDPRYTTNYVIAGDPMPFTEARIAGNVVDFGLYVSEETTLNQWSPNQIRGFSYKAAPTLSAPVTFKTRAGYAVNDPQAQVCWIDNTTCYVAKVVASISGISASSGYTSGSQLLTISGQGFTGAVSVTIDGQTCVVQYSTDSQIVCSTGANSNPSPASTTQNPQYYIGAPGIQRSFINGTSNLFAATPSEITNTLSTTFETPVNVQPSPSGNIFTGLFKAPLTCNYYFYMSCDDACTLSLSTSTDPTLKQQILKVPSATNYRGYFQNPNLQSAAQALTAGQYYYIEALHQQWGGGDHFTVAVMLDGNTQANHPQSMKAIQRFQIQLNNVFEQSLLTISNPDGSNLYIEIPDPTGGTTPWTSGTFSNWASAGTVQSAIQGYWSTYYSSSITVTRVMTDASGNTVTTTNPAPAQIVYTITVNKALTKASWSQLLFVPNNNNYAKSPPSSVQLSSPPLSGDFAIQCTQANGSVVTTGDISATANTGTILNAIESACPQYLDKLTIWDTASGYYQNGRDFQIRFGSYNGNPPQMVIQSSTKTPTTGGSAAPTFTSTTPTPYNSAYLFYEPIPYEMLFTNQSQQQVHVSINGQEAVCSGLACNYQYVSFQDSITSFSINSANTQLTILGSNIVTTGLSVTYAYQPCTVVTASTTSSQIVCTLKSVTAGTGVPTVINANGLVPISSTLNQVITVSVSSVSPASGLNAFGGNILTINGKNFPNSLTEGSTVKITMSDGSTCSLLTTSPTQMTCQTSAFNTNSGTSSAVTVNVNGQTDSTQSVTFATTLLSLVAPNSQIQLSPVLPQNVTISYNPAITQTLSVTDLSATIVQTTNSSNVVVLNTFSVDNTAKTITFRYNGAASGTYNLVLQSASLGFFSTASVTIQVIGTITSFSPTTGSILGGTLLTINGYVFSNTATDNAVQVGSTPCDVVTTSPTSITCRLEPQVPNSQTSEDVIVFLRTFEEATCAAGIGMCQFTWAPSSTTLASYSVAFDSTQNQQILTLTGTFGNIATTDVTFYIDGTLQTVTSASSTTITISISGMWDTTSTNVSFYLPSGTPSGASQLTTNGITLVPNIVSVTPSQGVPAGSILTATVPGVGVNTTGANLVTSSGTTLCASVTIPSYGVLQCTTTAGTVAATTLGVSYNKVTSQCATPANCAYQTMAAYPTILSNSISGNTIVFSGSNFFTSGYTSTQASFGGVNADTVVVNSATMVTATWNLGVPIVAVSASPSLWFVGNSATGTHWASTPVAIQNTPTATSIVSGISCSFAGGCSISINQQGLAASLSNPNVQVEVCGIPATFSASASTAATAVVQIPPLQTVYSMTNYNISLPTNIYGTAFSSSSNPTSTAAPWDGIAASLNGFVSSTSPWYFGTGFGSGFVGELYQVKFWMNRFVVSNYAGNLVFQGCNDKINWVTLITVGNEIHEGWNYYYFQSSPLKYRYYQFASSGPATNQEIGEVQLYGAIVINDNNPSYTCKSSINIGTSSWALSGSIMYTSTSTPFLTSISPRFGNVKGGDSVTFTGTTFSSKTTDYTITLDGINCVVTAATSTSVTCTTGKRPGIIPTSTVLYINGLGQVATNGLVFRYVNYWSDPTTWGGAGVPMAGNSIVIPQGLNLLVDTNPPILNSIDVEGSLIFAPNPNNPNDLRTFDASYIMVKGGLLEVGTEDFPYTSQIVITLHGSRYDPKLPTFGNKVIACYQGTIDLHGVTRNPTWTELLQTANPGDTEITLNTAVDWQPNEIIVIAPTGFDPLQAEEMTIKSVDNSNPSNPVITLTQPLQFSHFAGIQQFNNSGSINDFIEMRAEVILLTRNVVVQGDSNSAGDQFGAQIMLSSPGDNSLTGRIAYIEVRQAGQAYFLGKYPIHFHMIGQVTNSYVIGNSIHETYNRAVTAHHVDYLRVMYNVAYNTMGHTFFIEDAIETNNYYYHNVAIQVHASWALLNTDTTPACFWITNQNNIFIGNHAVGSERYGYWFDSKPFPTGPSAITTYCPDHDQLGQFVDNVAHSNNKYGLRIFHKLVPTTYPCLGVIYDATKPSDPYWQNPLIPAQFIRFTGWMNEEDNAIFEEMGAVSFIDFKVADALLGQLEVSFVTDGIVDGYVNIVNALSIGQSVNTQVPVGSGTGGTRGIITTRSEYLTIQGAAFYNFPEFDVNGGTPAAFGTCSHCWHPASTDSGARQITVSGIRFDYSSVYRAIIYQTPFRDIFYDLDGSFTGLGPKTWATPYWQHNVQPECQVNLVYYNGLICDSSIQVRRIAFWNLNPEIIFDGMLLHIQQYDASQVGQLNSTDLLTYQNDPSTYSAVPFKLRQDPGQGWAVPFVTGHKYRMHWGFTPLDWMNLEADLSVRWQSSDLGVYMIMNFTDQRQQINVTAGGKLIPNQTLTGTSFNADGSYKTCNYWLNDTTWLKNTSIENGYNIILNDTATRETHIVFNGYNGPSQAVNFAAARCVGPCLTQINQTAISSTLIYWSDVSNWPNNVLPAANDNVTIQPGWNMIYDISDSPIINYIEINGQLTFLDDGKNHTLRARDIFVREGLLLIGSATKPYSGQANIIIYGDPHDEQIVFSNSIEAGNKILTNTNVMAFYGKKRQQMTRLQAEVYPGQTTITVETGLDWVAGDSIALAPTSMIYTDVDFAIVDTYDTTTGIVTLDRQLSAYHYGASAPTDTTYGIDMRGEVLLLSRNIKIVGDTTQNAWGCTVLSSDFNDFGILRNASTTFDNVEIQNCSQFDTMKAALRFNEANLGTNSITNCAIFNGWGMGITIESSSNVYFANNNIFSFVRFGVYMDTVTNIQFVENALVGVWTRGLTGLLDEFVDISGGFVGCSKDPSMICSYSFLNNIAAGTYYAGFLVHGHDCGNYQQTVFNGNIAHSSERSGAIVFPDVQSPTQSTCMEASYFYAYKCQLDAITVTFASTTQQISHMIFVDNAIGPIVNGNPGSKEDYLMSKMNNITIWGESPARDCLTANACFKNPSGAGCIDRQAFWAPYFTEGSKVPMPTMASELPLHRNDAVGNWGGDSLITNINFNGFNSLYTYCGNQQTIFNLNEDAPDYSARAKFVNVVFNNVHQDTLAFMYSPPEAWANPDDCGNWPCSGPNNTYWSFSGVTYTGSITPTIAKGASAFQILPLNSQAVSTYPNCKSVLLWNAYFCQDSDVGILLFESMDSDNMMRTITPITISNNKITSISTVNTMMDHVWDGFYTGQLRQSRWPSIVTLNSPLAGYTISYSGTPPNNQRFKLITDSAYGMIVTIQYPITGTFNVLDSNGNIIQQNQWNDTLKAINPVAGVSCGENSYTGVIDTLQFFITPQCLLQIQPFDSITTNIRLSWTLDQFYADGGSTTFSDRMAAALGVQPQDIRVVSVYQGSVVVVSYASLQSSQARQNYNSPQQLQGVMTNMLQAGQINLGAPVISASISNNPVTLQPSGYNVGSTNTTYHNNSGGVPTNPPVTNTTKNSTGGGTKVITIDNNGTQVIVQTSSTNQASNLTIIIVLAAIAGAIILGGILGFVIYKKCGKGNKSGAVIPNDFTATQVNQDGVIGNSPNTPTEIQYHPKAEIGTIFGGVDQTYKTNYADNVVNESDISHMSNVKLSHPAAESPDRNIHTNQQNYAEGDHLNQLELNSNRVVGLKSSKRGQTQ